MTQAIREELDEFLTGEMDTIDKIEEALGGDGNKHPPRKEELSPELLEQRKEDIERVRGVRRRQRILEERINCDCENERPAV